MPQIKKASGQRSGNLSDKMSGESLGLLQSKPHEHHERHPRLRLSTRVKTLSAGRLCSHESHEHSHHTHTPGPLASG